MSTIELYELQPALEGDISTFVHKAKLGSVESRVALRQNHYVDFKEKLYRVILVEQSVRYNHIFQRAFILQVENTPHTFTPVINL